MTSSSDRPSSLDLSGRIYRSLLNFGKPEELLIEESYREVRKENAEESQERLSYFEQIQNVLEGENEFPEYSSSFFTFEEDAYDSLKEEFDQYSRDTAATYSAIEAIVSDMRNPLNSGQFVFKRIFGHFSHVQEQLGAQLSYKYFFSGNPENQETNDPFGIRSTVQNYFKQGVLRSYRRYSAIQQRLDQDFEFAKTLQSSTDTYVNRPGILPIMDLIRSSSRAIDIDIFQLQNESVLDLLVAQKIKNPELKIRVKLAGLDEGRIDRISADILAPNSYVSGVLETLNSYMIHEGHYNDDSDSKIEILRARSRNHPKLIVGDTEAIIGSMNLTAPLGNNPLKAGSNFELIRRVRNQTEQLPSDVQEKIEQNEELDNSEYNRLSSSQKDQYLNTYLYNQLKRVMEYNITRFKEEGDDLPFEYSQFRQAPSAFGTGTALVGGPSDIYNLFQRSLDLLKSNEETSVKYGLIMNIDQPLILQGALGAQGEGGYRQGEFGSFSENERQALNPAMTIFQQQSLQLLEAIGKGYANIVVDPRNYRSKVLEPFREFVDPLIKDELEKHEYRLDLLVSAKASGETYEERLGNLTKFMEQQMDEGSGVQARDIATQMLALTSPNIQMAAHPKAHAKGFSLFEIQEQQAHHLVNSTGSGNFTPGSMLPTFEALKKQDPDFTEEEYRRMHQASSNELSLLGYRDAELQETYGVGSSTLATKMANEMGEHLQDTFDELTYKGRFQDGLTSLQEGGPAKFQSTDGRWERGVDIARTAKLKERIQNMFDETGLSERGASVEFLRNNQSDATRLIVNLNINQMAQTSGVMARKYEISVLRGGQVYIANKGLVVSSAIFTNSSNMPFRDFFGKDLQAGETRKLSSEDVALSIFSTMSLEALNLGLLELPKLFGAGAEKKDIYLNYLAEVLDIEGDPTVKVNKTHFSLYNAILNRFHSKKDRLKTLVKLSETLFKDSFIGTPDSAYQQELKRILAEEHSKDEDRLNSVLSLLDEIERSPASRNLISQRVYSQQYSFSYELNERLQALETDIFKPFLTYTQSHTYSASTETTRKIRLGLGRNPTLRDAVGAVNKEESPWKIARYAALALPFAGIAENIEEAFISSVAGGVPQIDKSRMLSTFFGTRSQSYEEVKSLDLIEILSVGSRISKETIEEYLAQSSFKEEDKEAILEQFTARLGTNQFITTFGGESKFSQIGQRLKNVGGSRALMEMSYSAQYLMEQTGIGKVESQELQKKLAQDPFGFLLRENLLKDLAVIDINTSLTKLYKEISLLQVEAESRLSGVLDPFSSSITSYKPSSTFFRDINRSLIPRIKDLGDYIHSLPSSVRDPIHPNLTNLIPGIKDELSLIEASTSQLSVLFLKAAVPGSSQDLDYAETIKKALTSVESTVKQVEALAKGLPKFKGLLNISDIEDIPSLQQAYLKGMRQALTAFGVDPGLAERVVSEELSIAAIAGGRIGTVIPSDVREIYQEEKESLSKLLGKEDTFFDYGVGQELLRVRLAYRETETQGPRGALGPRRKTPGFSLLQVGGFYYDANFFFNPNYDEGIRYFFSDRVQKSVMSSNISLEGLTFDIKAGDIIRPISGDETQFGVYRGGKQIDTVTDRSQVKVIKGALDSFSLQGVQGKAEVTRKASTPLGREAMELVVNTVETTSGLKAAIKVEVSLVRSTLQTAGARVDTNVGLIKGVGIPSSEYAEYAAEQLELESSKIFGIFNESSMKSYIYGHGITIARDEELRREFIERVEESPEKAAAAIAYMFSKEGPYTQQDFIESKYIERALRGDYGEFFRKEAVAQSLLGKGSPLKEAYERVQTPSLGIGLFKEETLINLLDPIQSRPEATGRLIQDINTLMDQVSGTPATVGAGAEGLKGREADIILTAMDFFMQLSEDRESILPPGLSAQPEAIRTLALGAGYSFSDIEEGLKEMEEGNNEFAKEIINLTRTPLVKFYFTPSPGQMKTPFSSQSQSKAEIQARLTPFVTTRDSFTSRNSAISNIRRVLAAGLLMISEEKDSLQLTIKETKSVSVAGFADADQQEYLRKILSLQEAYRTLSGIPPSTQADLREASERMRKIGEFESSFYEISKTKGYGVKQLEEVLENDIILDQKDKEYLQTELQLPRSNLSKQEELIKGLFFKRAEEISLELREKSLPTSQALETQIDVDASQAFINRLKEQGVRTFGLNLPEIIETGSTADLKIRSRFTIKAEESTTGVILGGEYLSTLNSAAHQDFVSPILTTQAKLHEHLAEGSILKDVLRKVLVAPSTKKGKAPYLELTTEEFKVYTEFRNLLSKTAEQLTESLSESFLKQTLGAQTSSGFVGTGVGSLALNPFEAHVPRSARERAYQPEEARKLELERVLGQLEDAIKAEPIQDLDLPSSPEIKLLTLKAKALLKGVSLRARQAFYTNMEEKRIEENLKLARKAEQADEYIYELMLRREREESLPIAEPGNFNLFVGSYVKDEPVLKIELSDLGERIDTFIKTLEQVKQEQQDFIPNSRENLYDFEIKQLKDYRNQLQQSSNPNQQNLIALRVQKLMAESGDEGIARILRSAPTGNLEISSSIFYQTSLEEINQRFGKVSKFDPQYQTGLDKDASSTLTMVPLLSAITTMLGDFDGDQMIGYFVKFSDKVLRKVELEREIKKLQDQIDSEESSSEKYQGLVKDLSNRERSLASLEIEIDQLKSNLNQENIENAVISHVSAYLGIDKSYFLAEEENYFFKLLDESEQEEVRKSKTYSEYGIRTEQASLQEVVSLLEQGRGLIAPLSDLKSLEDKLADIIKREDYAQLGDQKEAIEAYVIERREADLSDQAIAKELAAARKSSEFSKKIAGLAKGHLQEEQTLMLGLSAIGQAGSVILGKTYNILYDSLLVDAPILAIKKGLEASQALFIDAIMSDLALNREEAVNKYQKLLDKLTEGYESTRALKAFTMSIEQMMRDSIKPKKNKAFLENLQKLSEDYNQAIDPKEKEDIIKDITKNLGSGPKGLLALINLHDFLGDNAMKTGDKRKLLNSLLGSDSIQEVSKFLNKADVTSVEDIPIEELDAYLQYLLSRDALNTSAGFMYERTLGINSVNLFGIGELFSKSDKLKKSIKRRFGDNTALDKLVDIPEKGEINISHIKDLGLRRFIQFYNDESKKDGEASTGELVRESGELTKKGYKALEYWLGRYKDSINLFGAEGESIHRLRAIKSFKDRIISGMQEVGPLGEEILDVQLANIYKTLATRGQGSIPTVVKQLSKFTHLMFEGDTGSTLDQLINFLDKQSESSIYTSEQVSEASREVTNLLGSIKQKLGESEGEGSPSATSKVAHLFDSLLGLTHSGDYIDSLRKLKKEQQKPSKSESSDYLISKPSQDTIESDLHIENLKKFIADSTNRSLKVDRAATLDDTAIQSTLDRFGSEGLELGLESLMIPALILGHAIASGYDPGATTGEVLSQQVVGGTLVSSLYMTNFFSQMESPGNRSKVLPFAAKSTIFGSAAKVRLTMAQEEDGGSDIIGGVLKTAAMEASFVLTSSLVSNIIETSLKRSRKISRTLDVDALEGPKTVASFIMSSLFSAAAGLMAQSAAKQIIQPSALELLKSVVGNLAQTIGQQRTQTARYETESVEMETEVDFPVYELTALTDYVQADLVAEHILTLSSTEMSGEAMEEAVFVRDAEEYETV